MYPHASAIELAMHESNKNKFEIKSGMGTYLDLDKMADKAVAICKVTFSYSLLDARTRTAGRPSAPQLCL